MRGSPQSTTVPCNLSSTCDYGYCYCRLYEHTGHAARSYLVKGAT